MARKVQIFKDGQLITECRVDKVSEYPGVVQCLEAHIEHRIANGFLAYTFPDYLEQMGGYGYKVIHTEEVE